MQKDFAPDLILSRLYQISYNSNIFRKRLENHSGEILTMFFRKFSSNLNLYQ